MKFCKKCGNPMEDAATFCGKCGTAADMPAQPAPEAPAQQPAPASAPGYVPNGYVPNGYAPVQPKPPVPHYAPGSFAEKFHKNVGNNMLFMIAIILTSAAVLLQLITNIVGIANNAFQHVYYLFGTLVTGGTVCTAVWMMFVASKKPALPEKCNWAFLLLKGFFALALLWQGLGLLVDLSAACLAMTGAGIMGQMGVPTQEGLSSGTGVMLLFKAILDKGTMIPYLCAALYLIIQLEKSFKEDKDVITISKLYAILCLAHAVGGFISAFFIQYDLVNILGILVALVNAGALVLYGLFAFNGIDKPAKLPTNDYRPY